MDRVDSSELAAHTRELYLAARFQELEQVCDRAIQRHGPTAGLLEMRAEARSCLDDQTGALADAESAIELAPGRPSAYGRRAAALERLHLYLDAVEAQEQALEVTLSRLEEDASDAEAWIARASLAHDRGEDEEALQALDRALQVGADPEEVQLARSLALATLGQVEGALESIEDVLEARPSSALYRAKHTWVLMTLEHYAAAEAAATDAIDLNSNFATAWQLRAWQRFYQGRAVEGARDLQRAARLLPESPSVHADRASILYSLAYAYWEAKTFREHVKGWFGYHRFCYAFSREVETALELDPRNPEVRQLIGVVRQAEGRGREGQDHLRIAVSVHTDRLSATPDDPRELLERAWCHLRLDETDAARRDLERLIEIDNDGECAERAREYLRGMDGSAMLRA